MDCLRPVDLHPALDVVPGDSLLEREGVRHVTQERLEHLFRDCDVLQATTKSESDMTNEFCAWTEG